MDRLISEKAVLEAFRKYQGSISDFYKAIKTIPSADKYEYHTDCIWYGNDSGCPVTCSQYRDGWNDAMDYIYKNGKGYQPYIRE